MQSIPSIFRIAKIIIYLTFWSNLQNKVAMIGVTTSGRYKHDMARGGGVTIGDEGGEKSAESHQPKPPARAPSLSPNHSQIKLFPSNAALKRWMMIFLLWWKSSYDSNLSSLDCVALFDLHWRSITVQPVLFAPPRRPQFGSGPLMPPLPL